MHIPQLAATLLAVLSLTPIASASPIFPSVAPRQCLNSTSSRPYCSYSKRSPQYCQGTAYNASAIRQYVCGDSRLGPRRLPSRVPLETLVETYDQFGGLCPGAFLSTWWNASAVPRPGWKWPAADGFSVDVKGEPIKGDLELAEGVLLDRFGGETGTYVSPAASPYMQRALPPSSLIGPTDDPTYPYNYHVYRVTKAFTVLAGPITPWFGQPGQGVQYQLSTSILKLIEGGFLERVDPDVLDS